ncbi:dihydroxyacetone kinase subunit DhaK [Streptacidiphilus pinicola]|uniref:phosphoenolpyruvate--glycerone phosphotransferase n=1 Tax=Streptacidiphilus pinicola TaxID=2219663 RepID=A0A2X0II97_9ACTN|nr:dihydroxyacetone kinase subunit DhaK [Streptacidiphilus pinicola]RAG84804.1 dihydroxyacetone kinase subunit DhaK [Streptacidiphilus pinicola]
MKKFLNTPDSYVADGLAGLAAAHPTLTVVTGAAPFVRRTAPTRPGKVALISGGGSGHEPLHAGFVGVGMLDAACPGEVFTSPVPGQMVAAAQAVDGGAGVVFVVKNYTGDVLNFRMAAELADEEAGIVVETVLVDDDVAVQDSTWTAGRRGTGATLLVEKLAGALAERGADLAAVADLGRRVNANARSFAVALTGCTTPANGKPGFLLPEDEMEVGVGIHGEPGRRRQKLASAREVAELALDAILAEPLFADDAEPADVIVMVNGLGATPLSELYILFNEVSRALTGRGVTIARSLVGNYVTSLDMAGASFTLCRVDDELLELWDAPVNAPALRWGL